MPKVKCLLRTMPKVCKRIYTAIQYLYHMLTSYNKLLSSNHIDRSRALKKRKNHKVCYIYCLQLATFYNIKHRNVNCTITCTKEINIKVGKSLLSQVHSMSFSLQLNLKHECSLPNFWIQYLNIFEACAKFLV